MADKTKTTFFRVDATMRPAKLSELKVGMRVFVAHPEDPKIVWEHTLRGRLNERLPGRYKNEKTGQWTDMVIETEKEYQEGYLSWVKFLAKRSLIYLKEDEAVTK